METTNGTEILYSFKDCYELQLIDTNCNNCIRMERNLIEYKRREDIARKEWFEGFEKQKQKAINEALEVIDNAKDELGMKSGKGMLRVAEKMKTFFEKKWLIQYGYCSKLKKQTTFIPVNCCPENQECFLHRKEASLSIT